MHVSMWEQKLLFPHEEGISDFTDRLAILHYAVASHACLHGPLSYCSTIPIIPKLRDSQ